MLDSFVCCDQFFKRISDCKVTKSGVRSNHSSIMTKFRLISIKFNNKPQQHTVINWERIRTGDKMKQIFNKKIQELMSNNQLQADNYTNFNSQFGREGQILYVLY